MKKQLFASILIALIAVAAHGQQSNSVIDLILKSYSARTFTSEPVSAGDLELILKCGIKAPSASNAQPWKFIVARETSLMQEMVGNVVPGNVLIIVCGSEARPSAVVDFDCGLATENMTIAAQSLGLGARIYFSSLPKINSSMKQTLQIPDGYRAVAVLRVGHIEQNVDASTVASPRNSYEDVVTFLK
jgi:nitroreductase